jgi:hypothetical protein
MGDDWQQIFCDSDGQDLSCLKSSLVKQPETAQRVDLILRYVNLNITESNGISSCPGEERKQQRGTKSAIFRFF